MRVVEGVCVRRAWLAQLVPDVGTPLVSSRRMIHQNRTDSLCFCVSIHSPLLFLDKINWPLRNKLIENKKRCIITVNLHSTILKLIEGKSQQGIKLHIIYFSLSNINIRTVIILFSIPLPSVHTHQKFG